MIQGNVSLHCGPTSPCLMLSPDKIRKSSLMLLKRNAKLRCRIQSSIYLPLQSQSGCKHMPYSRFKPRLAEAGRRKRNRLMLRREVVWNVSTTMSSVGMLDVPSKVQWCCCRLGRNLPCSKWNSLSVARLFLGKDPPSSQLTSWGIA